MSTASGGGLLRNGRTTVPGGSFSVFFLRSFPIGFGAAAKPNVKLKRSSIIRPSTIPVSLFRRPTNLSPSSMSLPNRLTRGRCSSFLRLRHALWRQMALPPDGHPHLASPACSRSQLMGTAALPSIGEVWYAHNLSVMRQCADLLLATTLCPSRPH